MDGPVTPAVKADAAQERTIPKTPKIKPDMSDPTTTAELVKKLAKRRLHHDQAAGELAPLFGLGDDLLAKTRTQCLFSHAALNEAFHEFDEKFVNGDWELPLPEWQRASRLALEQRPDADCAKPTYPDLDVHAHWDVNDHYAWVMTRVMTDIKTPSKHSLLLYWVRDAGIENGFWVLFHTLMYLHLEKMRENKRNAPLKARLMRSLSTARK